MTETEFRIKHSKLIEYYQLIEFRLKGICSALLADKGRAWLEGIEDYESDPLGKLISEARAIQRQTNDVCFTEDDFTALDNIRKNRNYWCHQCFGGIDDIVVFKKDKSSGDMMVSCSKHAERLDCDLHNSIKWDKKLTDIFRSIAYDKGFTDSLL